MSRLFQGKSSLPITSLWVAFLRGPAKTIIPVYSRICSPALPMRPVREAWSCWIWIANHHQVQQTRWLGSASAEHTEVQTDVCSEWCTGLFTAQCQRPPACSQGRSEVIRPLECSGASVCKVGPFCQLVKVNKLDQVREFGVPVVKAEECLPIILAR